MSCEIQPARHNHQLTHQQGIKWAGKAWPKMTKYANFRPNLVVFGQKILTFNGEKKGIFAQKRPNLAQNWHFRSIWARPCRLIQCPVGGSVGGCGARAVSCKTPIYFMVAYIQLKERQLKLIKSCSRMRMSMSLSSCPHTDNNVQGTFPGAHPLD